MKKYDFSMQRVWLWSATAAVAGSLVVAGCDSSESDGQGGNGGGGGETSEDVGTGGTGGTANTCDPTFPGAGGGGAGGEGGAAALGISGTYTDQYGSEYTIEDDQISSFGSVYHIVSIDEEAGFAVAENDADNEYNPSLYSRFDWAFDGKALYLCQSPYDATTAEEAEEADFPDASDWLAGCDGFAWSRLSVPCE